MIKFGGCILHGNDPSGVIIEARNVFFRGVIY